MVDSVLGDEEPQAGPRDGALHGASRMNEDQQLLLA